MLSLRALLDAHPTLLVLDAASACVQVSLLRRDAPPLWENAVEEAGTALFSITEKLLARANLSLDAIDAFAFCDGPGSVLGIRTSAVALRTWNVLRPRPVYAFQSLAVVAHVLARTENLRDFSVIADARRETWHELRVAADGTLSPLQRTPAAALTGAMVMPENFRHWSALPAGVRLTPYTLAVLFPEVADAPLFTASPEPDAFLHEEPAYATWTPQIHRAPTSRD